MAIELDGSAKQFVKAFFFLILGIVLFGLMIKYENKMSNLIYNKHFKEDHFTCTVISKYIDIPYSNRDFIKCRSGNEIIDLPVVNENLYDKASNSYKIIKITGSNDLVLQNDKDTLVFNSIK